MTIYPLQPIPALTEVERKNPYAKLYDRPIPTPEMDVLETILPDHPMAPSKAISLTELDKLFLPDALPAKRGYCLLPDGTGYHAMHIVMPDVTPEMERFWVDTNWIAALPENYKIWFPGFHDSHQFPVHENLGWGYGLVHFLEPLPPEKLHLSASPAELDPRFLAFSGSNAYFQVDGSDEREYNVLLKRVYANERGGVEVQVVVWHGVQYKDGQAVRMLSVGETANLEHIRLFACHNAWETTRKGDILPDIYQIGQTL